MALRPPIADPVNSAGRTKTSPRCSVGTSLTRAATGVTAYRDGLHPQPGQQLGAEYEDVWSAIAFHGRAVADAVGFQGRRDLVGIHRRSNTRSLHQL